MGQGVFLKGCRLSVIRGISLAKLVFSLGTEAVKTVPNICSLLTKQTGVTNSSEKPLTLGKIGGRRRRGRRGTRWLRGTTDLMALSLSEVCETVTDRKAWHLQSLESQRVGHN